MKLAIVGSLLALLGSVEGLKASNLHKETEDEMVNAHLFRLEISLTATKMEMARLRSKNSMSHCMMEARRPNYRACWPLD